MFVYKHIHKHKCTHIQKYNILFYTTPCNSSLTKKKNANKGGMTQEKLPYQKKKKNLPGQKSHRISRYPYFKTSLLC